ncbi:helix-turn-helix domain-containing protein [Georgenia yuyongxinii]
MNLQDAADYLGVTERSVRNWISAGKVPAYRIGKKVIRLKVADVDALLQPIPTVGGAA